MWKSLDFTRIVKFYILFPTPPHLSQLIESLGKVFWNIDTSPEVKWFYLQNKLNKRAPVKF